MPTKLFDGKKQIMAQAMFVGQRIDTKAFREAERLSVAPMVVRAGHVGCAVVFRYGSVVVFGLSAEERHAFLEWLKDYTTEPYDDPAYEEIRIAFDKKQPEKVESDLITLANDDVERLQLVADILGKSVVLSFYEANVARIFDKIEPMAAKLHKSGRFGRRAREFLRHMGQTLLIQTKIIGRVEVDEKPDLLWDRPDLERTFSRLEDEYELRERHIALKQKLELIYQTAETMMGLLSDKRTLHVEWYITILIVIEIVMGLTGLFH